MNDDALLIKDAAKLLQIGSTTLYELLHQKGYITRGKNFPRDDMVKAGYFKSVQRSRVFKRPGESQAAQMPYWVTVVTDLGMDFLRGVVTEYKAASAPAPGYVKVSLDLNPQVAHALVRYSTLLAKPDESLTADENAEFERTSAYLKEHLAPITSVGVDRNKKLFSHPKFQTAFHTKQPQQAH